MHCGLDSASVGSDPVAGFCAHCSVTFEELLDQLSDYHFLKKDCAPWRRFVTTYPKVIRCVIFSV
jgi:hypothetical protein